MNVAAVRKSVESPEAQSTVNLDLWGTEDGEDLGRRVSSSNVGEGSLHPASPFTGCATRTTGLGGAAAWDDLYKAVLESRPGHTILHEAPHNLRAADLIADWWMHDVNLPVEGFQAPSEETVGVDLLAALADLDDVGQEARDEGFQTPSEDAIGVAERLLRAMYELRRCRFEVYPTQDGDVAVSAPGGHGRSVLVVCDSEGGVLCSVNLNGQHRRAVYDSASAAALPDGFVQEALAALDA